MKKISRRSFLKYSAAMGATTSISGFSTILRAHPKKILIGSNQPVNGAISDIGIIPVSAALMEDHSDAFIAWKQAGFKKRTIVHIDSHFDMEWVSSSDLKRIVNSKTAEALKQVQLDPLHPEERSSKPLSIMNFLYPAIMEGMAKELYWVAPDSLMTGAMVLNKMKAHLIGILNRLSIDDLNSFRIQKGVIKGMVYGIPLTICGLSDLPRFNEAVLLTICVDYFDPPNLGKRLDIPSIWPEEFITTLTKKGIKSDSVTISYSVKGGYLALEYKFLGDDLSDILKDPKGSNSVVTKIREHRKSGHVYRSKGMYLEAANEFQKGLELSPNDAALRYGLGLVYDQWGKANEASIEFGRAKTINSMYENPESYDADYYLQKGMYDRALPFYEQVLKNEPNRPKDLLGAGLCFSKQGKLEEAVEYYQILSEKYPNFYLVHFNLGVVYSQLEQWEKAEMEYRRTVALNPYFGKAYQNLGSLYASRQEKDKAIAALEKAVANNPCFKETQNNLGSLYASVGKYGKAISAFKNAVRIDPQYAIGYNNLGKVYLIQGKGDDALRAFQQALSIDPKNQEARYYLERIKQ